MDFFACQCHIYPKKKKKKNLLIDCIDVKGITIDQGN